MTATQTFADLGVPAPLVSALDRMRIREPFEIQELTLPDAVAGRDVLGRAPTGSGKTLAFGLAALTRLADTDSRGSRHRPAALILSPTRELAEQICRELEPLAREIDRSVLAVYGGKGLERQITGLRKGVDVLVACPGRLLDLMGQGYVDLSAVSVAVVDEADRMADMGFLPDVRRILDETPDNRQTLLFSATLDNDVRVLIDSYQRDPVEHAVADLEPDLTTMSHRFIKIDKRQRAWLAADLITDLGSTVVFVRTRHGVDRLVRQLGRVGVRSVNLHGGRSQSQRDRALATFSKGKSQALVATDVAARGIHVDGVACVIHYDPPAEVKDYVHRSGRTARAGAEGVVVSFLAPDQVKPSLAMQKTLGVEGTMEDTPERRHRLDPVTDDSRSNGKKKSSGKASNRSRTSGSGRPRKSGSGRHHNGSERNGSERNGAKKATGAKSRNGTGPTSKAKSSGGSRPKSKTDGSRPKSRASARSGAQSGANGTTGGGAKGKAKHKAKSKSKSTNGQVKSKSAQAKPKSKRSGKPRPKNRKNKPTTRRRSR